MPQNELCDWYLFRKAFTIARPIFRSGECRILVDAGFWKSSWNYITLELIYEKIDAEYQSSSMCILGFPYGHYNNRLSQQFFGIGSSEDRLTITSFSFQSENNPALSSDVTCAISGLAINCSFPQGVSLTNLTATFDTAGASITVNEVEQVSGKTSNDFSKGLTYVVTYIGEIRSYVVSVVNDQVSPAVESVSPEDGASDIALDSSIAVTFNVIMDASSITTNTADTSCSGTVQLSSDSFSTCVKMGAPVASNSNKTFTLTPAAELPKGTTYRIKVLETVKNSFGVGLTAAHVTTNGFTTKRSTFPFFADDGSNVGLWITNGTEAGTTLLKNIAPLFQ